MAEPYKPVSFSEWADAQGIPLDPDCPDCDGDPAWGGWCERCNGMSAADSSVLGTFGPMVVRRLASGPKLGYVLLVEVPGSCHKVEIRCSPEGQTFQVREILEILWSSEEEA